MTRSLSALLGLVVLLTTFPTWAQGGLNVELRVDRTEVEVDEWFTLSLSAMSNIDNPSSPSLRMPAGIVSRGSPVIGTQSQITMRGGVTRMLRGIRATWTVRATRRGRISIGPATVLVNGQRESSNAVAVNVVPVGQGSSRSRARRPNPFGLLNPPDPFGTAPFPGLHLDLDDDIEPDLLPPYPRELAIDRATDDIAFLRATLSPQRVVVGEPTTLRIVAYGNGGRFREGKSTEPVTSSFVSYPIIEQSWGQQLYQVPIGNQVWRAVTVRELLLFPVDTGALRVGPMKMEFVTIGGRPYMGRHVERESPEVELVVTEPPRADRPKGYQLGDVGRFTLEARVEPREVAAGQAISVVVKVQGAGNFPSRLRPPQQNGVEWLEPTVKQELDVDGGQLKGYKRLSYVVRLQRPGTIDLGEITLPHWDPVRHTYTTARADLGVVAVKPGESTDPALAQVDDRLATIVRPRTQLGPPARQPLRWGDSPWLWVLLGMGPISVVSIAGVVRLGSSLGERWRAQRESQGTLASKALADAQRHARAGDAGATASASERALFLAIEAATGLKARGALRNELAEQLAARKLSEAVVREVTDLLDTFDAVRFTGGGESSPTELVRRTQACMRRVRGGARRKAA